MKEIQLTKDKVAKIDNCDFEEISKYNWKAKLTNGLWYANRKEKGKTISMHRQILNDYISPQIDHADGDGLNNQRYNIRPCTHAQNQMNSKIRTDNTSGIKGVCWNENQKKWRATIRILGKQTHLGNFKNKEDAIKARKDAERIYHGEFARQF